MLKRLKHRYVALEIDSEETFSQENIMEAVWVSIQKLYGEYGASRSGLHLISYDAEKRSVIIRVHLVALEMVRAALASLTKINDKSVAIHVLRVSGTIRSLGAKPMSQLS